MNTQAIAEASKALEDALHEEPDAVRVGDLVIDESTGEVLEWPAGVADQMEALVMRDLQAKQNIDGWERTRILLKLAIGRLLDQQGVRSFATQYGKPTWMAGRRTETADVAAVQREMVERELPYEAQVDVFLAAAKGLDAKRLREVLPDIEELISVKNGNAYVQVNPPTQAPPAIERVS